MRTLVLYFSVSGNTEKVAQAIAGAVDGETIRVQPKGKKKVIIPIAAFQSVFKASPAMDPLPIEPAEYDLIFVGYPVWAGHAAPWMNSLSRSYPLAGRNVAFFCTCGNSAGKSLEQMRENFPNANVLDTMKVVTPMKDDADLVAWAKEVVRQVR